MTCRICLEPDDLVSVCACRGTQGLVHKECVQRWVDLKQIRTCELCMQPYDPVYIDIPDEPQIRENNVFYLVIITAGIMLNAVAAAGLSSPEPSSILIESFCFCLAVIYFWYSIFKLSARWALFASIIWSGVFIILIGIFRTQPGRPFRSINIYAFFLMLWTYTCCLARSLCFLHSTQPPNESHTIV